ncbi:MAG TPA: DUF397 domain-containing protein [Micromonosporaceae bacterium]|nr:DUF397 domain-containing protein [Micromonosporaceae bacterium]
MTWRKSSFSAGQGDCVELAWPANRVAMRDSKNPAGPVLLLGERARAALIAALKA